MRNALLLLLVSVGFCIHAQSQSTPPVLVAPGEYQVFFWHSSDRILYSVGGAVGTQGIGTNPTQTLGTAIKVQFPAGTQMRSVSSPLHNGIGVDMNGNVWFWGNNDGGMRGDGTVDGPGSFVPVQVAKDSSGNAFNNVAQVSCWWNETNSTGCLAVKNDGTVWVWGNTIGGMRGNGQYGGENYKPVQVNIPGNPHIVKVLAGEICMALDNAGNVYTWGGNGRTDLLGTNNSDYTNARKVPLPKPAKDIAGADMFAYALATDGTLYGWGIYGAYLGIGTGTYLASNTFQPLPVDLTSQLNLPHPVAQIMCNTVCTHVILTDSTLWGWGDNTQGGVGNGIDINFGTYPTLYQWDWGASEVLQHKPVQVLPLHHNFIAMFAGTSACFYNYAETSDGQLYSWGRNKSMVLANGVLGATSDEQASYPDGWEQPTATAVNPFTLTKVYASTCPYCLLNPGSYPCSEYKIPADGAPVSVPGPNQTLSTTATTAVLDGSGSHDPDGIVVYYKWRQVSGPTAGTVLDSTYSQTRLSGLKPGTYVYSLTVTDNGWATNTANVTVTVSTGGKVAPTVSAGSAKTITLPTSSSTLTGTAAGNGGATISSLSWKETSGPATATISSATSASTGISGLTVAGNYVFTLTATDNNSLTTSSSVTVTVNPAVTAVAPTVSAGSGSSITLPTSSATLTGKATANGGATIQGVAWKETSGPATATISAPGNASTTVSGLTVAGSYVFTLTATENNSLTASGSVTITVNAATVAAPPTVSAGKGQAIALPTSSANLAGTATGNGGATIRSVSWKQGAGPVTATISSPTSLATTVSGMTTAGSYIFTLTAIDNNGKSANGSMTVTVNPNPGGSTTLTPPTVSAGKGQAISLPTSSANLAGTATGNGGATIRSVSWKQGAGPLTATISSPTSLTTTVSGMTTAGSYIFTLTAVDNNGKSANGSMTVTVNPNPNGSTTVTRVTLTPPTVSAGKGQAITLPTTSANLAGTATGNGGATITNVSWKQGSGPVTAKIGSPNSVNTAITGLTTAGNYIFTLTATDNNGETANGSMTITVNPGVQTTPTVSAGADPTITLPTNSITLKGSASGTNGATITSVFWELVSGPGWVKFSNEYSLTNTVSGMVAGTYVFQLTATDNHGKSSSSLVDVVVKPAGSTATQPALVSGSTSILSDSIDNKPLAIFPNPVHDLLNIRLNTAGSGKVLIVIYDQMGNRVLAVQAEKDNLMLQTSVDVSRLAAGAYTLQVMILESNSINTSRFIKL